MTLIYMVAGVLAYLAARAGWGLAGALHGRRRHFTARRRRRLATLRAQRRASLPVCEAQDEDTLPVPRGGESDTTGPAGRADAPSGVKSRRAA